METPQESRDADEKPNNMEDSLKEAMERMRRKHAMRTAGLLESNESAPPPEDDSVREVPCVLFFLVLVFFESWLVEWPSYVPEPEIAIVVIGTNRHRHCRAFIAGFHFKI